MALATALRLEYVTKRFQVRWPWRRLPGWLWPAPISTLTADSDPLAPPWPDVVISSGRKAAPVALAVKRRSDNHAYAIHIQDPRFRTAAFDLIVAPRHDDLSGENVIVTRGGVHGITSEVLAAAARDFSPTYGALPQPRVAVLVGGSNRRFTLDGPTASRLAAELRELVTDAGASLMVTASRRTDPAALAALRAGLADLPAGSVAFWSGDGANPYFGFLALADAIVVTCDSVNMITEACATGRPVYIAVLPGGSAKFRRFHDSLFASDAARPFTGRLEDWSPGAPDDMAATVADVQGRLDARFS